MSPEPRRRAPVPARWAGPLLVALALTLLLVVPVRAAPADSLPAGACGSLVREPRGREFAPAVEGRPLSARLFQEQRLEAACEDAASAHWLYVGLVAGGLGLALWRALRAGAGRPSRVALTVVAAAVLAAAVFDGPPASLGVAVVGSALALRRPRVRSGRPA